jgi:hypothetical protein
MLINRKLEYHIDISIKTKGQKIVGAWGAAPPEYPG